MLKRRKKRINNKGFSLIELLVAIAILAVIVTPILKSMVTSMKVNKKADDLLNETAVAQTVMEGMQNMTLEEIARDFSEHTNAGVPLSFLPPSMGGTVHTYYDDTFTQENGSYVFHKSNTTDNKYVFGVKDVIYDNKKFDVKVTLDASSYYKNASETTEKHNDKLFVDLSDYDSDYDGLYVQNSGIDREICSQFLVDCVTANTHKVVEDIEQEADRTITVNFETTSMADAEPLIETIVEYDLEIPQDYVGEGNENSRHKKFEGIYKNTEDTNRKPRNIYILYNPNYHSVDGHLRDHIVINNPDSIPVTVYLIKQSSVEEFRQSAAEQKYRVDITIKEGAKGADYATKLRTNIGYNLYDLLKTNTYREEPLQAKVVYECDGASYVEDIYTVSEKITGGSNDAVRIFKKKVEVYPSGSYAANDFSGVPLATLDSEVETARSVTAVPTP